MAASKEEIGALARQLQNSAAWKEIVAAMKAEKLYNWANSKSDDETGRELLYRDVQAIGRLEAAVQSAADNLTMDERKAATAVRKGT